MRQLTVLAVSDDGTHLLLAASQDATKPTHQIRIDDRLAAAVRGELDDGPRRESALTPKEIQARLRAGDTPEQVAKAANVPVNRVLRFFGPVESERDRIIGQAQAATMRRTRGPATKLTLGEAVERRLSTVAGLRRESVEWTAKRRDDGAWVVALTYAARGGSRSAAWLWHPSDHDLTALDLSASRMATEDRVTTPRPTTGRSRSAKPAAAAAANGRPVKAGRSRSAPPKPTAPKPRTSREPAAATPPARVRREPKEIPPPPSRSGRVPVPAWDDVLFGAARPASRSGSRRTGGRRHPVQGGQPTGPGPGSPSVVSHELTPAEPAPSRTSTRLGRRQRRGAAWRSPPRWCAALRSASGRPDRGLRRRSAAGTAHRRPRTASAGPAPAIAVRALLARRSRGDPAPRPARRCSATIDPTRRLRRRAGCGCWRTCAGCRWPGGRTPSAGSSRGTGSLR